MAVLIRLRCGVEWYTNDSIAEVRAAVDAGQEVEVWWFAGYGQRFTERAWIAPDEVAYVRTEQDDG